jgi:dTDP-4-amino-4,6-dideoxygalactose transaminase
VPVHYAGIACDMDKIMALAERYNLFVIEDAAQAIDSHYKDQYLGGIGHLSAFSFHETKNIIAGEGGMLVVNDERFVKRAEIIWEKGTNRSAFFRGEIDKYGWVDIGSSFLPSEVIAAFLYAQIEHIQPIQQRRKELWELYRSQLQELDGRIRFPYIPSYATNNAHMFYIICGDVDERDRLIRHLKANDILAVFHYLSLHKSPFYKSRHDGRDLPYTDYYSDRLLRLPLFYELTTEQVIHISSVIKQFYLGQ